MFFHHTTSGALWRAVREEKGFPMIPLPKRIKTRSLVLCFVAVCLMIASAAVSFQLENQLIKNVDDARRTGKALRNHTIGDMVHDGLRSTVYGTLMAEELGKSADDIKSELDDYVTTFRKVVADNRTVVLDDEARKALDGTERGIENYIELASRVVSTAIQDRAAAVALLPEFEKTFKEMEEVLEKAGNRLEEDTTSIAARAESNAQTMVWVSHVLVIGALVAVVLFALFVNRGMLRPILAISVAMKKLAGGDLQVKIAGGDRVDEIGDMLNALAVLRDGLDDAERLRRTAADQEAMTKEAQRAELGRVADLFQSSVGQITAAVAATSHQLEKAAGTLDKTASEAARVAGAVDGAAASSLANVRTVADAASELTASVEEIGRQVHSSADVSRLAVGKSEATNRMMQQLAKAASEIGDVVGFINTIARQTNLLALNATIEAARAGEAGRGFAVVAQEVKTLAEQTSEATGQISAQIAAIQDAAARSVEAIQDIGQTIDQLSGIAAAITGAVVEQERATQDISRSIAQAADGTATVTSEVVRLSTGAQETDKASKSVHELARELGKHSEALGTEVQRFLKTVRAA